MSENWFYRVFGEEFGPVTLSDLREFVSNGTLSGSDEVRPEALTMWVPARVVRELQDLNQAAVESTVTGAMNAAAASPTVTDEWYYRFSDSPDTEVGPLTFDGIIELAKSGRLMADDEVRLGVDGKWRRAGNMGRLVAVLPYQTRRQNLNPTLKEVTTEELPSVDAVQDLLDSLPDEAVQALPAERKTPRPQQRDTATASTNEAADRNTPTPKSKPRRGDSKRTGKPAKVEVASDEILQPREIDPAVAAALAQEIEDQILEELMAPAPKSAAVPMNLPHAPVQAAPLDSWASTPHATPPSSPSFNRSTQVPTTRPLAKQFKPVRSGPSLAERFQDPRLLKAIALLVVLGLPVLWLSMPESNGADVAHYRELDNLFTELRDTRAKSKDGKALVPLKDKFEQTATRIANDVKSTADADHPARQRIFWAASQGIPEMCKFGLAGEVPAETQAVGQLESAAVLLGLKEPPKVDLAELSRLASEN